MQKLFVRVLAFFVSAVLSFMGTQNHVKDAGLPFGPEDETGILLNAAVVSDTHTNGWTPHAHNVKLMKLLCARDPGRSDGNGADARVRDPQ